MAKRPDRPRTTRQLLASIHRRIIAGRWQAGDAERSWPWYHASNAAARDVAPLLSAAPPTPIRRKARRIPSSRHANQ